MKVWIIKKRSLKYHDTKPLKSRSKRSWKLHIWNCWLSTDRNLSKTDNNLWNSRACLLTTVVDLWDSSKLKRTKRYHRSLERPVTSLPNSHSVIVYLHTSYPSLLYSHFSASSVLSTTPSQLRIQLCSLAWIFLLLSHYVLLICMCWSSTSCPLFCSICISKWGSIINQA